MISPRFIDAVRELKPDVLILNEFKDGFTRKGMRAELAKIGLAHWLVSDDRAGHNQVLIASSNPIAPEDLHVAEVPDSHARTNFLHVLLPMEGIEVVGFRAPAYKAKALRRTYWEELTRVMRLASDRRVVFAGDFNADPARRGSDAYAAVIDLASRGWNFLEPTGAWSFCTGSRIDHAVTSPGLKLAMCQYVVRAGDLVLSDSLPGESRITRHCCSRSSTNDRCPVQAVSRGTLQGA